MNSAHSVLALLRRRGYFFVFVFMAVVSFRTATKRERERGRKEGRKKGRAVVFHKSFNFIVENQWSFSYMELHMYGALLSAST